MRRQLKNKQQQNRSEKNSLKKNNQECRKTRTQNNS